jgi:PAS domain S-box-containing protein
MSADDLLHVFLSDAVPVQLWMATPDGRLDFVNERVTSYFGRTAEELLGEGWQSGVHPSDLGPTGEKWRHSLETGEPYTTEFRLQRASDGLYRWHLGLARAVRDADDNIVRWVGSNTDIDDQKRAIEVREAARELAEMEVERLEEVIRAAPAVMAIYRGPDHEIVLVNDLWERFTGRTAGDIGRPFMDVFPDTHGQGLHKILGDVYRSGKPYKASEMHLVLGRDENGDPIDSYWTFSLARLDLHGGRGHDILVHAVEVSELVNLRDELRRLKGT